MDVDLVKRSPNLIARLNGELDHHNADSIRNKLDAELEKGIFENLLLDLSQLSFMDSSGLGVILGRYKKVSQMGGQVVITGVTPQIQKLVELSGLTKLVNMYKDEDEAILKLEKGEK